MNYQVQITLPKFSNNGKRISPAMFSRAEQNFLKIAGGFSSYDSNGVWQNGIDIYTDRNRTYQIVCRKSQVIDLRQLCEQLKLWFEQEAIFFLALEGRAQLI